MKKLIYAATVAALAGTAMPAVAQTYGEARDQYNYDQSRYEADQARYQQQLRNYRAHNRQYRIANRDWRDYRRYDYNRVDPAYNGYYADRYYRDGSYYQPRRLSYNDRVYRGQNGQYYCRRSDGTTGLIIGAGVGALFGNAIDGGRSSLLGTLLGAGVGGAIGISVDRNNVRCR